MPRKRPTNEPLYRHSTSGQWMCKRQGRALYFGHDKTEALKAFREWEKAQQPGARSNYHLAECLNHWCSTIESRVRAGEVTQATLTNALWAGKQLTSYFRRTTVLALIPASEWTAYRIHLTSQFAPHTVNLAFKLTRAMLNHCIRNEFLDKMPNLGEFKRLPRTTLKRSRNPRKRCLTQQECWRLFDLEGSDRSLVIIGLNLAAGAQDLANLSIEDIEGDHCRRTRGKNAEPCEAWLWPESKASLADFPWHLKSEAIKKAVSRALRGLRIDATVYGALRHTPITLGAQTGDLMALRRYAGHVDQSVTSQYVHHIASERIEAICQHIRGVCVPSPAENLRIVS